MYCVVCHLTAADGRYRRMYDLQVLGSKAERESMRAQGSVPAGGGGEEEASSAGVWVCLCTCECFICVYIDACVYARMRRSGFVHACVHMYVCVLCVCARVRFVMCEWGVRMGV